MNEEEKDKALQAVKDRFGGWSPVCPLCKKEKWALSSDIVMHPLQTNPPGYNVGGPSIPTIVLTCLTCGNTQFLNAIILGLKEVTEKKKVSEKKEVAQ